MLTQRTGDPSHLERARPVLERLGDRQFLHRLEEVAGALPAVGAQGAQTTKTARARKRAKARAVAPGSGQ